MTASLLTLRKKKDQLFKDRIKIPSEENISRLKDVNSTYKKNIREAKNQFYREKFEEYSNDIKNTWGLINQVVNKKKHKQSLPTLLFDEFRSYNNIQSIVNGMNDYFVNVGQNLAEKIPDPGVNFEHYLGAPSPQNFIFAHVTEDIILKTLQSMKPKKSCGEDGMSIFLIKHIINHISKPLIHLFNLSFKTGFIPESYKVAKIIPIFKAGEKNVFNNYRPISILSAFSKILEKIAANQIMKYLEKYQLLHTHQYGFRKKHSTTLPVLNLLDKIFKSLNEKDKRFSICIFADLSKAFDTVDKHIQLKKLEFYGFRNTALKWFQSYLTGRQQFISVDGTNSNKADISHGVPQGSVLGPLLFLIYINDLPNVTSFLTYLYADDTSFLKSSNDLQQLINDCNNELKKAQTWFNANKLSLNVSKTKYMIFRNSKTEINEGICKIKIGNEEIERIGENCKTKSFKFVGIFLDEFLTFEHHVKHVAHRISGSLYALKQAKSVLSTKILKLLYNALVKPHLDYGLIVWGGTKSKSRNNLVKIQKNIIRVVSHSPFNAHTSSLFGNHDVLKLDDMYLLNVAEFIAKWYQNKLPSSMQNILTPLLNCRSRNLRFEISSFKSLEHLPAVCFPRIWNSFSMETKLEENMSALKKKLHEKFCDSYKTVVCNKQKCYPCKKA